MGLTAAQYRIENWINKNLLGIGALTLMFKSPDTVWVEDESENILSITCKGHNRFVFKDIVGHIQIPEQKAKK